MKKGASLFILVILLFTIDGTAHSRSDSLITLRGIVEFAIKNSITMRIERTVLNSSYLDMVSAKNTLFPSASAGVSLRKQMRPINDETGVVSVGADYDVSPSKYLKYKATKESLSASQCEYEQRKADLVVNLILYYLELLRAKELVKVEEQNVSYQMLKMEEIKLLFEQGRVSRTDTLLQYSIIAEARVGLLQALHGSKKNMLSLLDLAGLPVTGTYTIDTMEVNSLVSRFASDTSKEVFKEPVETKQIVAQHYRIHATEAALKSSRLSYVPSLSLSAGWAVNDVLRESSPSLMASGSVTIPLFDKKQRWLQVKNAEQSLASAFLELENRQKTIEIDLARAVLDDIVAKDNVEAGTARCESTKEALGAMEERYKAGSSTLSELMIVQNKYFEAQSALVRYTFDRVEGRISLLYTTGQYDKIISLLRVNQDEKVIK